MNDLNALYQSVILDHNKHPRNFQVMEDSTHSASGHNPLCGDSVILYLEIEDHQIKNATFKGSGCAISVASSSLMTEALKGLTLDKAKELFYKMHESLIKETTYRLGKLEVLSGVKAFPARVKCASLPWHTLMSALSEDHQVVSTA